MSFEELQKKALNKEIKLEDLDAEDILKFNTLGFLNPTLKQYFNIPQNRIDKIRKQKGITNALREDCIRNIISIMQYNIETNQLNFQELKGFIIIPFAFSLHGLRPEKENAYESIVSMDWENININEEIINKKIDVEFRLNYLFKNMPELQNIIKTYKEYTKNQNTNTNNIKYNSENTFQTENYRKLYVPNSNQIKYKIGPKRNPKTAETALKNANYLCEINPNHTTFIKKSTGLNYMEPHHLIPLEFQDYFKYSLDVEANIISLCSCCHDEIHYGINNTKLITKLYNERITSLKKAGLNIDLETLLLFYEYKRKQLENIIKIEDHVSQNN